MSIKDARQHFSELVDAVERGESVTLTRRGRKVARIRPVCPQTRPALPDLRAFRSDLTVKGAPLSATVVKQRGEERY